MTTIHTTFDPSILPAWAQHDEVVLWLCERNLAFRAEVCRVETEQMIDKCRAEAAERYECWINA